LNGEGTEGLKEKGTVYDKGQSVDTDPVSKRWIGDKDKPASNRWRFVYASEKKKRRGAVEGLKRNEKKMMDGGKGKERETLSGRTRKTLSPIETQKEKLRKGE